MIMEAIRQSNISTSCPSPFNFMEKLAPKLALFKSKLKQLNSSINSFKSRDNLLNLLFEKSLFKYLSLYNPKYSSTIEGVVIPLTSSIGSRHSRQLPATKEDVHICPDFK